MDGQPFGEEVQTNSHELLVIGSHLKYGNQGSWEAVGVFSPLPRHCPPSGHPLDDQVGCKGKSRGISVNQGMMVVISTTIVLMSY